MKNSIDAKMIAPLSSDWLENIYGKLSFDLVQNWSDIASETQQVSVWIVFTAVIGIQ